MQEQQQLPADARPITFDDLFAAIGELYVQVRVQRQMIAQQQEASSPSSSNGVAAGVRE
jgi:hypothetical protein